MCDANNLRFQRNRDGSINLMHLEQRVKQMQDEINYYRARHYESSTKLEHHIKWGTKLKKENEVLRRKEKKWGLQTREWQKRIKSAEYHWRVKKNENNKLFADLRGMNVELEKLRIDNDKKQKLIDSLDVKCFLNAAEVETIVCDSLQQSNGDLNVSNESMNMSNSTVSTTVVMSNNTTSDFDTSGLII